MKAALVSALLGGGCLLVGSCVQDYRTSTPQAKTVMIVDKQYSPAHSDLSCTAKDSRGGMECHTTYYPETWSVDYADEERWTTSVSKGTWDALHIGDSKVIRFNLGGGWWHARYDERFELGPVMAESASWPTR